MRLGCLVLVVAMVAMTVPGSALGQTIPSPEDGDPHVVVGIPDSGINPYHKQFHRPSMTEHPCERVVAFPCSVEKLNLSIELAREEGYEAAVEADEEAWESVERGTWYWIPKTSFVAVYCGEGAGLISGRSATCILDDGTSHGTGTTSAVLSENPDALLAFKQGGPSVDPFVEGDIPVDVYSVSWGSIVPLPLPRDAPGIYVKAAGNDPRPILADGWSGNPGAIAVGGGYTDDGEVGGLTYADHQEHAYSAKQPDVVSYYCRQRATADSTMEYRRGCGTSYAAPSVAGGLSKAILDVRQTSGYPGPVANGIVDGELGISIPEFREAMNRTATYEPQEGGERARLGVPLNSAAPWLQWGWGFYDGSRADETVDHLTGDPHPAKPENARTYMHTLYELRQMYATGEDYRPDASFDSSCYQLGCTFDASSSSDEQVSDDQLEYSWTLGDGTTASGPELHHSYAEAGSYQVELTVSDGSLEDTDDEVVTVSPAANLQAEATQDRFAIDENVTIEISLATPDGTSLSDVPIHVETNYRSGQEWTDSMLGAPIVERSLQTANRVNHQRTVVTDEAGTALVEFPGEVDETGERVNAPTLTGEYEFTAEVALDNVYEYAGGSYEVGPSPG